MANKQLWCGVSLYSNRRRRWSDTTRRKKKNKLWWISRYWMQHFCSSLFSLWCVICYIRLSCFMQIHKTCWSVWTGASGGSERGSALSNSRPGCKEKMLMLLDCCLHDALPVIYHAGSSRLHVCVYFVWKINASSFCASVYYTWTDCVTCPMKCVYNVSL